MTYAIIVLGAIVVFALYSIAHVAGEADRKMEEFYREKGEG